jgi:hypothetical protein
VRATEIYRQVLADDRSSMRRRFEACVKPFNDALISLDDDAAQLPRDRQSDILINLNGCFGKERAGIFAGSVRCSIARVTIVTSRRLSSRCGSGIVLAKRLPASRSKRQEDRVAGGAWAPIRDRLRALQGPKRVGTSPRVGSRNLAIDVPQPWRRRPYFGSTPVNDL